MILSESGFSGFSGFQDFRIYRMLLDDCLWEVGIFQDVV
jgi:hypothetical protein